MEYKLPFTDEPHSRGNKIVDGTGRIICYTPKGSKRNPDNVEFVLEALNEYAWDHGAVESSGPVELKPRGIALMEAKE